MEKEIDHEYTDEIVCPHCWKEMENSSDWLESCTEGTNECYKCWKDFEWNADFSVSYSTSKVN